MANIKPKEIINILTDVGFQFVGTVGDHGKFNSGDTKLTAEVPVAHAQSSEGVIRNCLEVALLEAKIRNIDIFENGYSNDIIQKLKDIDKKMQDPFFVMPYQSVGIKMIPGKDKIEDFIKNKQKYLEELAVKNKQMPTFESGKKSRNTNLENSRNR